MKSEKHYLTPLLDPQSIAIVGASEREGSIGATLVRNMLDMDYQGKLFFVNPKHKTLFGKPCYASVGDIPQRLDLAVICTQAKTFPAVIDACGRSDTRSALVITGGFAEIGQQAASLKRNVLENARRHRLRLLGPDCLGIMRPGSGINLTFTNCTADAGSIGLISQSGALCSAVLDWAQPNKVGFSSVVSLDNSSDVDFGEILDYMATDPKTKSIFLYIEGIKNARHFMSALRAAARCKPVLLIKVGRHPAGEQAAFSHCGAQVGADDVFDAALRRAGVVRLFTVGQMYATAQALFAHFHPRGNRLAIITNGGGPGVMAADHAEDIGIPLAKLDAPTLDKLDGILPPGSTRSNPIDIGGDAGPARYAEALQACQADSNVDGILSILTPQAMTDPTQTARAMIALAQKSDKPLVTCWMGETQVSEALRLFKGAGIPTFRTPEPAVELFSHISHYFRNQQLLLQTPPAMAATSETADDANARLKNAQTLIKTALQDGRTVMNEKESVALLAAFNIPIAPMAVKPNNGTLTIGVVQDRIFGPAITLGPRSEDNPFTDQKRAVALPPLNRFLVDDLLQSSRIAAHLDARNDKPAAAMEALRNILLSVSEMVCELPWLREMEINPLIVDENGTVAANARIVIANLPPNAGRYDHMAIHPYPAHLVSHFQGKDGQTVTIRPIKPEDAAMEQAFIQGLSAESRYFRFMNTIQELPPAQLARLTQIDYDREMAFVATLDVQDNTSASEGRREQEVGVVRYATNPDGESCEFAIVVADDWQGTGLARQLMNVLIETARNHGGLKYMNGDFLVNNPRMIKFVSHLGFTVTPHPEDSGLKHGVRVLN